LALLEDESQGPPFDQAAAPVDAATWSEGAATEIRSIGSWASLFADGYSSWIILRTFAANNPSIRRKIS
jgi:hypothetical protein